MFDLNQLSTLLAKDFRTEFRQRVLTAALLLFVGSACFSTYQVFFVGKARVNPLVWNSIFWLIVLFSSFQTVVRSFHSEMERRFWHYFFIVSPELLIISKLVYHFVMFSLTGWLTWVLLSVFFRNPIQDFALFSIALELGSLGLAAGLTLVSAISSKAGKNSTLLPVLGFPLLIPTLLLVIRLSISALDGLDWSVTYKNMTTLVGLDAIMIALSLILFPYLWRS